MDECHVLGRQRQRHRAPLAVVQASVERLPGGRGAVKPRRAAAKQDVHERGGTPPLPLAAQALRARERSWWMAGPAC